MSPVTLPFLPMLLALELLLHRLVQPAAVREWVPQNCPHQRYRTSQQSSRWRS